jgi:hypothetical protein
VAGQNNIESFELLRPAIVGLERDSLQQNLQRPTTAPTFITKVGFLTKVSATLSAVLSRSGLGNAALRATTMSAGLGSFLWA